MGLLSGIKKVVKKVVKGVKKVYKKATRFVGKIAGSKWGKALLLSAAVFTGGMALSAGFQGFAATPGTFMTKFVAGAKAFMGGLANPVAQAKSMMAGIGAPAATVGQATQAAGAVQAAQAPGQMIAGGAQAALQQGVPVAGTQASQALSAATGAVAPSAPSATGGLLSRAASGAMDFAKSSGGGTLLSGVVKGYAEGKQQEELLKEQERVRRYYDKQWEDPNQLAAFHAAAPQIQTPQGFIDRARRVSAMGAPGTP